MRAGPVVSSVHERYRNVNAGIACAGRDHARHVAVDLTRDARIAVTAADAAQLREVVARQLAVIVQAAAQHYTEDRPVLHPRDHGAEQGEARAPDVEGG